MKTNAVIGTQFFDYSKDDNTFVVGISHLRHYFPKGHVGRIRGEKALGFYLKSSKTGVMKLFKLIEPIKTVDGDIEKFVFVSDETPSKVVIFND